MSYNISLLAHNIRSLWNVGAIFRNADCFNVEKIFLTGYTGTPPRREISKTAIGAEQYIPWEYATEPLEVISSHLHKSYDIVALEQTESSVPLQSYTLHNNVLLIIGQEVLGVPQELLNKAPVHIHIPMLGQKESLNVSVATGIALYQLRTSSAQ